MFEGPHWPTVCCALAARRIGRGARARFPTYVQAPPPPDRLHTHSSFLLPLDQKAVCTQGSPLHAPLASIHRSIQNPYPLPPTIFLALSRYNNGWRTRLL